MKKAAKSDKAKVVELLLQSFQNNARINYLTRNTGNKSKYLKRVFEYSFDYAFEREGVFLSDSEQGVALCYSSKKKGKTWHDVFLKLKLVLGALALNKLVEILVHMKKVEKMKPKDREYLHFWYFGVNPKEEPRISAWEMTKEILDYSDQNGLDIFVETTADKNRNVYERFGFQVYQQWKERSGDFSIWLMHRRAVV
jgi:hypothetical protein